MAKKTLKGKTSLTCDFDRKNRVYNCSMPKLKPKEKKKTKGLIPGEWPLPTPDMHKWNTDGVRVFSEVELPPPWGVMSRAGGIFAGLFPSGTYLECKTGVKVGKLSITDCTFKER